jgi:hypothetical protein
MAEVRIVAGGGPSVENTLHPLAPLAILKPIPGKGPGGRSRAMYEKLYKQNQMLHGDQGIRMPWSVSATRGTGESRQGGTNR